MQRKRYRTDVGFITYRIEESVVTLETVWVNRLQRGKGHGTKMLQGFLDTLDNCKIIGDVWNERPLNFYKKLGFGITKNSKIYKIEKEIR